jgi:iron(III) transport system permease protein
MSRPAVATARWGRSERFWDSRIIVSSLVVLLVAYLALIPLSMLIYGALRDGPPGEPGATFTLVNFTRAYLDSEFYLLFANSIFYSLGTCLLAFVIGTTLAWISERTNTPGKRFMTIMALVPFILPGILNTIAWLLLLSPRIGLINLTIMSLLGLSNPPFNIYSMGGMIWVEAIHLYPLVYLMMAASFRSMDMSLEEAALTSGAGNFMTFRRVTLRLMRPAIVGAMLIMFIRAIESFEVPALIGSPAGIAVFTSRIFLAIHRFPSDFGLAGAYAVTLLVLSTIGVLTYQRLTGRSERFATITGKGYRPSPIELGRWRYLTAAIAFFVFFVAVVLPLFVLVWSSFIPYYGVPSRELWNRLTMENYRYVLNYPLALTAFKNSFLLSAGSATVVMLLTSVIAWITVKSKLPGRGAIDTLTFIPIALPGIVLGLSLIFVYLTLPIPIYGTIWILLIAYVTKFMPYGIRTASASMIQISRELEEAAGVSGASWLQTFRKVILPLLMPGFIAGWIYVSIVALRELSTSILLYSYQSTVLSILVFDLWEGGQYNYVCALGILMVLLLVVMVYIAKKLGAKMGVIGGA